MHSVSALVLMLFIPASSQYSSEHFSAQARNGGRLLSPLATGYLEVVRFGFVVKNKLCMLF